MLTEKSPNYYPLFSDEFLRLNRLLNNIEFTVYLTIKTGEAEGLKWDSTILAKQLFLKEKRVKTAIASLQEKKLIAK